MQLVSGDHRMETSLGERMRQVARRSRTRSGLACALLAALAV
jgi:hypothetical protein